MQASSSQFATQCSVCGALLAGPVSLVFRSVGIRRSPRNPNLCTGCSTHVEEGRLLELTVVFADLSSFTEMTHDLGPEKTHEVVDAFLRMATNILVRHGAFIDKYVGDAVMALFNVPIRYADHARRSVFAAIELNSGLDNLRRRYGVPLAASIGIATGWARVGRLGSDDSKDYTAIGDVVNLAARLQGKANPGEILISETTYLKHSIDFPEAIPEQVALKGFREPARIYRLKSRADDRRPADDPPETSIKSQTTLGAVVFGILGAPCAVATLIGPLALAVGAGGLFGLGAALTFLDQSAVRIPILVITTLVAVANLYTLWHARRLRDQGNVPAHLKIPTKLEKRRTVFVLATSFIMIATVIFEIIAHILLHDQ
jgi:adenylate cyclase